MSNNINTNWLEEVWFKINEFLKEDGRNILSRKLIDVFLYFLINTLILITIIYASYHLVVEISEHFFERNASNKFPSVLHFAENIFLYFLPIFILFGLLNYYNLEWSRLINKTDKPNPNAYISLNLSKKLFFSSVLSYTTLKILELLFFNESKVEWSRFLLLGVFFLSLIVFVTLQHNEHNGHNGHNGHNESKHPQ